MVYEFGLQLTFRNVSRQSNAVTKITNYLTQFESDLFPEGRTAASCVGAFDGSYKWGADWQYAVSCIVRFSTQQTRDDLWNQLDTELGTGNNGPVQGSQRGGRAWRYDINADDLQNPDQSAQNYVERTW